MRKEPILFAVVLVLGGVFVKTNLGGAKRTTDPKAKAKEFASVARPDTSRSDAPDGRQVDFGRDLFTQPRDTEPLPPLGLVLPPLEPLGALSPPTAFGPKPALHAKFLRTEVGRITAPVVAGLFDAFEPADLGAVAEQLDPNDPEQRAARIAGFKRQFDWIYTNDYKFGQIRNEDRYRLVSHPAEPIQFFEVDPVTGQSRFKTESAIEYARERVEEFGFAETPANELELARVGFGATLTATDFERALRFADRCVELRNEAPRGLELAEEMYRLAQEINLQADPRPQLGLARCYELGFKFERAFETYEALLATAGGAAPRVLARLGTLRATLRLDARAEADLARAVELARTDWDVRQLYGRFLLERGRYDEALEQLSAASENEPRGDEDVAARVRLRADHAAALLACGKPDEALQRFSRAIAADTADVTRQAQVSVAGMGAAALLLGAVKRASGDTTPVPTGNAAAGAAPDAGFELLLTQGLTFLRLGLYGPARATLEIALGADPFRAYLAYGALSFLAESTGYPEEALVYIEEALSANPTDPWTLYQRGRLLAAAGDARGAEECFRAALDRELDHSPSLEELGALRHEAGDYVAAELYFERALALEPKRAVTWSRRGFNKLRLGDLDGARECFERARAEQPSLASAGAGLAFWAYASGDTQESLTLFAQLEEDRRTAGANDPLRQYAKAEGDRIRDHESKETWRDRFDREPGRIANDWLTQEGVGPETLLRDGAVVMEGTLDKKGRTRVFRELPTERFLSFAVDITIRPESQGTLNGIFLAIEKDRADVTEATAELLLARSRDGKIQVRVRRTANDDADWVEAPAGPEWPVGRPVRVAIERSGDEARSTFTVYVAGEPVFAGLESDGIQRSRFNVRFGVFSEGDPGRRTALSFDDVEVVRRR